jgi:bifunctional enzyme Fae/Hps
MLNRREKYLQIALNSSPWEGVQVISSLPQSDRIIIEAGTPLIKAYGIDGIKILKDAWNSRLGSGQDPYIVADTKCMDRGETEVNIAKYGGASAATVLGSAPIETINYFIAKCEESGLDSMVDTIGMDQQFKILRKLKKLPDVVVLHRGVDEEAFDKSKPIPYLQINKIRSSFDVMISVAGGDTFREAQRAIFNDADIVVVWKNFYSRASNTGELAKEFLKEIK